MDAASEHLRALARRIVSAAQERVDLRAALLAGSSGRGDADYYSDLDLLLYVDELPPEEVNSAVCALVGGTKPVRKGEPTKEFSAVEFDVGGIRVELAFFTVRWMEANRGPAYPHPQEADEENAVQAAHGSRQVRPGDRARSPSAVASSAIPRSIPRKMSAWIG